MQLCSALVLYIIKFVEAISNNYRTVEWIRKNITTGLAQSIKQTTSCPYWCSQW